MGMDLKAAGDLVAKTLGSSMNAMSRYGIQVEGAVGSTERLESLTGNVAKLFGGQAKAQAETMAGALEQAGNAAGDLGEAIGAKLSPLVEGLATNFKKTAEELTNLLSPEIDRESQLNELLRERAILQKDTTDKIKEESIFVKDLWADWEEGIDLISEEALTGGVELTDEQLKGFHDLIFAKKEALDITRATQDAETDFGVAIEKVNDTSKVAYTELLFEKEKLIKQDLRSAVLSGQGAIQAMKSVIRAETMEAVAGYLSSVFKTVPFPFNIAAAAGGGALVAGLMEKGLSEISNKFATGADFITSGPTPMLVGEAGAERVSVTPLQGPNINGPQGGITVNISAPLVDETVISEIIPAIERAKRMNLA
jgi:hypothetical protein